MSATSLGFFVGLGNEADIDFSELMAYAKQDPHQKEHRSLFIEGLLDSPSKRSFSTCKSITPDKPVVVIKAEGSRIGAK